jgi:hypothetical protein
MENMKKYLLLVLSAVSLGIAALFAFVIELPSGLAGYTVRAPFSGGLTNKPYDLKDYLRMDQAETSIAILATFAIAFLVAALVLVGLHFRAELTRFWKPKASKAQMKSCPFCAETIRSEATVCRFCGRELV